MNRERIKKGIMKRPELRGYEDKCTQNFPPACKTRCPVHVDVKGMCEAISDEDFAKAEKLYRKAVVFPNIISRICDRPCRRFCRRGEIGDAILISKLEEAAVSYGGALAKKIRPVRKREEKIAIIGASLEGLAAAMFLYEKGYDVTVFEKTDRLGGRIWSDEYSASSLTPELIAEDFYLFEEGKINVVKREIEDANELLGMLKDNGGEFDMLYDTVFESVQMPNGYGEGSVIQKLADGRTSAITIDRKLQGVSLTEGRDMEGPYDTELFVNLEYFEDLPSVVEDELGITLSESQAVEEADRCIRCECMECVKECVYLESMGSYPKKYVREISNNLNMTMGMRMSKNMVNSCTICGLCEKICPNDLHTGEVCMVAKVGLVNINAMPEAMHDFPIRDMEHAKGERFAMYRHEPGKEESKYLFFPGCQLGALEPLHIFKAYGFLRNTLEGGVGLGLSCCGAPAFWSGRIDDYLKTVAEFKQQWEKMGKPVVIAACTSCMDMLTSEIPELEVRSLWEFYAENLTAVKPRAEQQKTEGKTLTVHDACTGRDMPEVHAAVRDIIQSRGYEIEELKCSQEMTKCCGYGGLVNFTNREMCKNMVAERVGESDNEYAVYCAMCKELFTEGGKPSWHIFDIIYGDATSDTKSTDREYLTYSRRRENREKLKNKMLAEVWGDSVSDAKPNYENIRIKFDAEIEHRADDRLILESDIKQVIANAEETDMKVLNPRTNHYTASLQPGIITYWVEYSIEEDSEGQYFLIHKAYSHRIEINKKIKENEHRKYRI